MTNTSIKNTQVKTNIIERKASKELIFKDMPLEVIKLEEKEWVTSKSIAETLGYKDLSSINRIFNRKKDEFDQRMSRVVKLTTHKGKGGYNYDLRVFSLRGAYLISMVSDTDTAKEFRKWVLDVLEGKAEAPKTPQVSTQVIKMISDHNKVIKTMRNQINELDACLAIQTKRAQELNKSLTDQFKYAHNLKEKLQEIDAIDLSKAGGKRLHAAIIDDLEYLQAMWNDDLLKKTDIGRDIKKLNNSTD